jgi:integrase
MACISKRRGRWVIDFYDHQGKRRWKTMPAGSTKKKAKDALRDIEDQVARGIYLPDPEIPTFKKVAEDWLEYKRPSIRESTGRVYEGYLNNHLSAFAGTKVNRITTAKVEKFTTKRRDEGTTVQLIRKLVSVMGQIMAYAKRHGYISENPMHDLEQLKGGRPPQSNILKPEEINALLDATTELKYRTLFRLAIFSGARQGELLGLKWKDIDWDGQQIHIRRTFNHGSFYEPKTETSRRKIDLGPTTMAALKRWKLAARPNEHGILFATSKGQPIHCGNILHRYFTPALKAAKIEKHIRFHDMRHTFASLLIDQGESIKYIQTQLGHSNPVITLKVYAHLLKGSNPEAAKRLENAVFSSTGCKTVVKTETPESGEVATN